VRADLFGRCPFISKKKKNKKGLKLICLLIIKDKKYGKVIVFSLSRYLYLSIEGGYYL